MRGTVRWAAATVGQLESKAVQRGAGRGQEAFLDLVVVIIAVLVVKVVIIICGSLSGSFANCTTTLAIFVCLQQGTVERSRCKGTKNYIIYTLYIVYYIIGIYIFIK